MADTVEILVNVEQAKSYIESKRSVLVDVLANRMDAVNAMLADRVKGNLSGAVLQTQSGALLGTLMQTPAGTWKSMPAMATRSP